MKRPAFLTAAAAALLAAATASAQTPTVEARIVPDSIGIGDTTAVTACAGWSPPMAVG